MWHFSLIRGGCVVFSAKFRDYHVGRKLIELACIVFDLPSDSFRVYCSKRG